MVLSKAGYISAMISVDILPGTRGGVTSDRADKIIGSFSPSSGVARHQKEGLDAAPGTPTGRCALDETRFDGTPLTAELVVGKIDLLKRF